MNVEVANGELTFLHVPKREDEEQGESGTSPLSLLVNMITGLFVQLQRVLPRRPDGLLTGLFL